jgi:hypothetical protein
MLKVTAARISALTTLHYSLSSFQSIMLDVLQLRILWMRNANKQQLRIIREENGASDSVLPQNDQQHEETYKCINIT